MLYVGVDLSTYRLRALLMDEAGNIECMATRSFEPDRPRPNWSEQDPDIWVGAMVSAVGEVTENYDIREIAGIGVAGQMQGLVAINEAGRVLRPAILWNDARDTAETEWLAAAVGRDRMIDATGNASLAGCTAPKAVWMKMHEPELFAQVDKFLSPKDYLNYRLTGVVGTDYTDASATLLLDVQHKCWSSEMLKFAGIPENCMPALHESCETIGHLTPFMADQLNLSQGIWVAAGAGDVAAAAVGCGAVGEGKCNISLGTSGTVLISNPRFSMDRENELHAFVHADGGYQLTGRILSAGVCARWWAQDVLERETPDVIDELSLGRLAKSDVYFLPYLTGEHSPHYDPDASGMLLGLTPDTSRSEITQAVLEGVAFALRDCIELARAQSEVRIESATLCGEHAQNALWRRILAGALDMDLMIPETQAGPAYGAAMMAAVAGGEFRSITECTRKLATISERIHPDPALTMAYEKRYRVWHQLYPLVKEAFPVIRDGAGLQR